MSTGAYAPDKATCHPSRLAVLREAGHPFPVHLHLIVSDVCNLDCPGCAYRMSGYTSNQLWGTQRNPDRMLDLEVVKAILRDAAVMGTKAIELTGGGEPTVHPRIGEILAYAKGLALETALITNGLLLTVRNLIPAAIRCEWVRISIDAATPDTYGKVRPSLGGPRGDQLMTVLHSLSALRLARDAARSPCVIGAGFVVQRENWREIYDAVRLYKLNGADNVRISGLFTPAGDAYHAPHFEEARRLEQAAIHDFDGQDGFRVYGRFAEKVDDLHGPPDYATCHYQRFTTYIGADANLYRCCVLAYSLRGLLANVKEQGFMAAWLNNAWSIGAAFDARKCERCQFNDRNRAIADAIQRGASPRDCAGVIHPSFV